MSSPSNRLIVVDNNNADDVDRQRRRSTLSTTSTSSSMMSSSMMSSTAIDRLFLNCAICFDRYRKPKVLPCLHSFCEQCLVAYIPDQSLAVSCPSCRQQSILPKEGVSGLQDNTLLASLCQVLMHASMCHTCDRHASYGQTKCLDCDAFLCDRCSLHHNQMDMMQDHRLVSISELVLADHGHNSLNGSSGGGGGIVVDDDDSGGDNDEHHRHSTDLVCPNHAGHTLRFYCQDCETAVCLTCTDIEHGGHATVELQEAAHEQKAALKDLLDKAYSKVPCLKEAIDLVTAMSSDLESAARLAEARISDRFDSVLAALEVRRQAVLAELDRKHSGKQATLARQRRRLEARLADLASTCHFTETALAAGTDTDVLLVKKQMGDMLNQYANMKIPKAPEENDHLEFGDDGSFAAAEKSMLNLGSVCSNSAVASETTATGEGLRQCVAGRQATVSITTKDYRGQLVGVGQSTVTAELNGPTSSSGSSNVTSGSGSASASSAATTHVLKSVDIVDHKNGSYDLVYSVSKEGVYQLSILLYGEHIKGSPFKVKVLPSFGSCGGSGIEPEDTSSSDRPASSSKVATRTTGVRQRATKRTPSAKSATGSHQNRRSNPIEDDLVMRVGCKGRNKGEFTNPQGICCTAAGRIVVADSNNQCIQIFTEQGDCKLRFGVRGRSAGQLQRPTGVTVLPSGNYAVADYDNKWVSVFEPSGKFVSRIGVGRLLGPKGVAVNRDGHLIVVDNKESCVLVFQAGNGKLLSKFGSRGNGDSQFAGPHFVAVDSRGRIVISDFHNHCIKIFDSDGVFVASFGSNGEGNGQFNAPTGVAVDANDNILVADWGNSRIQVFDSSGSFLSYVNTLADPLYGPQGLALTGDGHIVIADSGNHCFKMYKYLQ